jgi:hypothetical protein
MEQNGTAVSRDFEAYFVRLVTSSLSRSAEDELSRAGEARFGRRLRRVVAERRSADRRRILDFLEHEPDAVRGYLSARSRARRARGALVLFAATTLVAVGTLAAAVLARGPVGAWVAYSDAVMVALGIAASFAYVMLVSSESAVRRRLERFARQHEANRRAGLDRRRDSAGPPEGVERRSGADRRAIAARTWSEVG